MKAVLGSAAAWIAATPLSNWLQVNDWVMPVLQSLHIIGIGIVFTCALMISLRLLNVSPGHRNVAELTATLVPWIWRALAVLVPTGLLQVVAEPLREFVTPAFWWKMAMLVLVVALTIWFARTVRQQALYWDTPGTNIARRRLFAIVSLALWVGIIFCGRFIGYTWSFYV